MTTDATNIPVVGADGRSLVVDGWSVAVDGRPRFHPVVAFRQG
ncbi:hypothetical protein [Natrarchaeobius chitinivorans]|nr:hypothetical protein [Natrarchaeobius chitinivorans]